MATQAQPTPFVKQLAANDRPTRERALASLQTYLNSTHQFTELELLKIWRGLFFCMYHTASPRPQTRLSHTLATLLLSLPISLFLPFLHAFYTTLLTLYPQLPSLRLDKYLYLLRRYVAAAFTYLARAAPHHDDLVQGYLALMQGDVGPLSPGRGSEQAKFPDGLRYHVLDVWAEELALTHEGRDENGRENDPGAVADLMMSPVRALACDAKAKVLRARARECVRQWDVLSGAGAKAVPAAVIEQNDDQDAPGVVSEDEDGDGDGDGEEWNGFGD